MTSKGDLARKVTFSNAVTATHAAERSQRTIGGDILTRPGKHRQAAEEVNSASYADDVILSHTSSSYELAEKGAGKVLIDSLQYFLDGLFSKRASNSLRRQSAWDLFSICRENANNATFLRSNGVFRTLARLPSLLLTERDQYVELLLLALSLLLIESDNGHASSSVDLPSTSFQALVVCSLCEKEQIREVCRKVLNVEKNGDNYGSSGGEGSSGLKSKRKMKRKFGAIIGGEKIDHEKGISMDYHSGAPHCDLVDVILGLWPQLLSTMLVEHARPTPDELGRVLSMTCVSSFLMTKAQACASLKCNSSPSRGDGSTTADKALARCQKVLSTPGTMTSNVIDKKMSEECSNIEDRKIKSPPLIHLYALQVVRILQSCDAPGSPSSSIDKNAITWQILSVMDAFCFRNHDTQHLLSCQFHSEHPKQRIQMREELTKLLFDLAPAVKQSVKDSSIKSSDISDSNGSSPSSSHNSSKCGLRSNTLFMSELNCGSKVEAADVFSMCLKCLVNLSHDNQNTALDVATTKNTERFLVDLLSFFEEQRRVMLHTSASEVKLSPSVSGGSHVALQESMVQRIIYNSMLHILALLTNLVENKKAESRMASNTQNFPRKDLTSAGGEKTHHDLSFLVVSILKEVSRSFVADMVDTSSTAEAQTSWTPSPLISPARGVGSEGDEGPIPVSDLIIAAHASLLLFSLGCPSRISLEKGQFSQIDLAEAAVAAVTSPEALVESATIRAALPGGKWWLLVRVLKAYLALQSSIEFFSTTTYFPYLRPFASCSSRMLWRGHTHPGRYKRST